MDQKQLQEALRSLPLGKLEYHPTIGSSNDRAAELAEAGAPHCSLVAADEQTSGRGRAGRKWITPPGTALAFSILLRGAGLCKNSVPRAAGLGALAVSQAVEDHCGIEAQIKWPNDVLLKGQKVCGVLAEAHWLGEEFNALILGIGVNVTPEAVPPAEMLRFPATSLESECGMEIARIPLLKSILEQVQFWWGRLDEAEFLSAWEQRLAFKGQRVLLAAEGKAPFEGKLLGLGKNGELVLQTADQQEMRFQAGEIQLRPAVDSGAN
jgi:BirA family biotin operon repressor/biotin-[acetyl-CoA-carboxylase] ligase